ncbi:hypothetical protein DOJK_02179 [Patescibacteria group bacterium]|nr:hypothetical protein [Candidatus Dojkabacteria bacterium]CAG1023224.1 hypothetical protein DOJK_02179 [Patescibacteria group bacterium]
MRKRKVIMTTAVAATAAMSSVFPIYGVAAQTRDPSTIEKAASYLGVDSQQLLDAFKKARIELVEDKIKNGLIDPGAGIELIHKIEDSDDFYILPKVA